MMPYSSVGLDNTDLVVDGAASFTYTPNGRGKPHSPAMILMKTSTAISWFCPIAGQECT